MSIRALHLQQRNLTPYGDYEARTLPIWKFIVSIGVDHISRYTLGFSTGDTIYPATRLLKNDFNFPVYRRPLKPNLLVRLGHATRLLNDQKGDAPTESGIKFKAILGIGCNIGIVTHGKFFVSANAILGEWAHNPILWLESDVPDELQFDCGRSGRINTFIPDTVLSQKYVADNTRDKLRAHKIIARVAEGRATLISSLKRYKRRLGLTITSIVSMIPRGVIVPSTDRSNVSRIYGKSPQLWENCAFFFLITTKLHDQTFDGLNRAGSAACLSPKGGKA